MLLGLCREEPEEIEAPSPETAFSTFEAKQLWQLCAGQVKRDSGFEASEHSFRDEVDCRPGSHASHAVNAITATSRAVQAASAAKRDASPPAKPASDEPTQERDCRSNRDRGLA